MYDVHHIGNIPQKKGEREQKSKDLLLHLTQLFWDGLTLLGVRCVAFLQESKVNSVYMVIF